VPLESVGTGRPLRICLISPLGYGLYRPDLSLPFGGAEIQLHLLATALAQDPSCAVTVLTTVAGSPGEEQYGAIRLIKRQSKKRAGPLSIRGPAALFRTLRGYAAAYGEMRRLLEAIDADVFVHAGSGVEVGVYARLCRHMGKRFIFVVASTADVDRTYGTAAGPLRWLSPLGIRWADAVVCRTQDQQTLLKQRYGREGYLIRTGHPVPRPQHAAPGTQHSRSSLLWIGRLHPVKQPERFLDLAERLADQACVMIGMRDAAHDELGKIVARRAATLPNLTLFHDVPREQVDDYLRRAKLLVNTSIYEGFSNTFVQAALAGVPICSLRVDPDGLLSRHEIGLCAGGNPDELAVVVRSLLASERRRREIGRRAAAYATMHHDLRRTTADFRLLAQSLVWDRREGHR
jgi:glycosyltransferase involved in cell wall biosynthesis